MERIIERDIKGKGLLTLGSLTSPTAHHDVTYHLDVYQKMIPVVNQGDPNATIDGMKKVRGRIAPVYFTGLDSVTLQMQDGRKMQLVVTDLGGAVVGSFTPY